MPDIRAHTAGGISVIASTWTVVCLRDGLVVHDILVSHGTVLEGSSSGRVAVLRFGSTGASGFAFWEARGLRHRALREELGTTRRMVTQEQTGLAPIPRLE